MAGCAESVQPYVGETRPFTLWGFLDAGADTQMVRVFSIEARLGTDRSGPIDAAVTSVDLDTGQRYVWRDSTVTYFDGSVGHIFWAPFQAEHGHRYRLEVARSDGATSRAQVTIPPPIRVTLDRMATSPVVPVTIEGEVPNLIGLEVIYRAVPAYPINAWPIGTVSPQAFTVPVTVSYDGKETRSGNTRRLSVDMKADFEHVKAVFQNYCLPTRIVLQRVEFRVLAADSSWAPPGGVFDIDTLIEPQAFSNVENGFGFFGAGQVASVRWSPLTSVQEASGYALGAPCLMMPSPACTIDFQPCYRCEDPLTRDIRRAYCTPDQAPAPASP
jgi:hypothetical protein